jgi:hypothetical protein
MFLILVFVIAVSAGMLVVSELKAPKNLRPAARLIALAFLLEGGAALTSAAAHQNHWRLHLSLLGVALLLLPLFALGRIGLAFASGHRARKAARRATQESLH